MCKELGNGGLVPLCSMNGPTAGPDRLSARTRQGVTVVGVVGGDPFGGDPFDRGPFEKDCDRLNSLTVGDTATGDPGGLPGLVLPRRVPTGGICREGLVAMTDEHRRTLSSER